MNNGARHLEPFVREDLARRMVSLSRPRQVLGTTLAQSILGGAEERYFNWDFDPDRERILRGASFQPISTVGPGGHRSQ